MFQTREVGIPLISGWSFSEHIAVDEAGKILAGNQKRKRKIGDAQRVGAVAAADRRWLHGSRRVPRMGVYLGNVSGSSKIRCLRSNSSVLQNRIILRGEICMWGYSKWEGAQESQESHRFSPSFFFTLHSLDSYFCAIDRFIIQKMGRGKMRNYCLARWVAAAWSNGDSTTQTIRGRCLRDIPEELHNKRCITKLKCPC